ncbi:hypothetical protein DACRYDRAFT_25486 [Dacryopinax primogenitus]|uniref:DUF6533 domain-containing protein n=1 Tax=Dacryopinax primogenitus (strain DJM 731) TaxID=1858805 RepID=M5FZ74_DACPD|nr:uncharacterized protein DACRYDRAFT_25486 [Dacryopinax primogenitus]EJT96797.1 hypothetical protein DACRYDRAFT_25486 [Dacryopinax primogenitus]
MSSPLQQIGEILLGQDYGVCAAASLIFFDYFLTFPQEVRLVWASKWTPGKVLFLFIRYVGLTDAAVSIYVQFGTTVTPRSCLISMYWSLLSMFVTSVAASLVLALRTWAIWNKSKMCGAIVFTGWIVGTTCSAFYTIRSIIGSSPYSNIFGLPGCIDTTTAAAANDAVKVYAFGCAYEILIFLLTLARGLQQLSSNSPTLLLVLYRDAFIASVWTLAFSITDVALSATQNPNFYFWCLIGFAFSFIVPTRIILNLRASTMQIDQWDVTTGHQDMSPRAIASPRRSNRSGQTSETKTSSDGGTDV